MPALFSRKLRVAITLLLGLLCAGQGFGQPVEIQLKNGTDPELRTKEQLQRLIAAYNLDKYTFTRQVVIDQNVIPHSHPVLTLHTRHLAQDDVLLSTYVHEQLHWYLAAHHEQTDAAEETLRKLYPKAPVGYPDGAVDEQSTYLHLIDCYLEMMVDRQLLGADRTKKVMDFWAGDHYRWVYRTIISDEARIGDVVRTQNLEIK